MCGLGKGSPGLETVLNGVSQHSMISAVEGQVCQVWSGTKVREAELAHSHLGFAVQHHTLCVQHCIISTQSAWLHYLLLFRLLTVNKVCRSAVV